MSSSKQSRNAGLYNFKEYFQAPINSSREENSINVILSQLKTGESIKFCEWLSSKKQNLDRLVLRVIKDDSGIWMKGRLGDCLSQLTLKSLDMQVGLNNNIGSQGTMDLVEEIAKQKSLEDLKVQFEMGNNISQIGGIELGKMLKDMTQLNSLCVNIGGRNSLKVGGLRGISEGLGKLVNLQILEVKIGYTNSILSEGAIALSEGLRHLVNLKQFLLQIGDYNDISSDGAAALGKSISKMINLEELTFTIDSENNIGSLGAIGIFKGISYLVKLKKLKLSIDFNNYIENCSLQEIGKNLQNLQELEKFQLFIGANNTSISGEGKEEQKLFLNKIIPENNMKNLRELDIFIGPQNLSLWQDEYVLVNLSQQKALERLTIRLGAVNEIKSQGVKYLMNAVSSVENLRYLSLTIGGQNDLGPDGAIEIGNGIKKLTQLKELTLVIAGNGILGEGLRGLSQCFREGLKSLESLTLSIGFQNKFISGIINLFEDISHLTSLRNLEFSLQDNAITVNHAQDIGRILTRLQYLTSIKYHFEGNPLDFSTPFVQQLRKKSPRLVILGKGRRY